MEQLFMKFIGLVLKNESSTLFLMSLCIFYLIKEVTFYKKRDSEKDHIIKELNNKLIANNAEYYESMKNVSEVMNELSITIRNNNGIRRNEGNKNDN